MRISKIVNKIKLYKLIKDGLVVGQNFKMEKGCMIDASFPWLISIGNNVTLAPYVYILSHDGSTKPFIEYSKIGKVSIGDNVFIGSKSIILPNINIGNNVVIAAGSIVTKNIPSNCVVAGNPAKVISNIENFVNKNKSIMTESNVFDSSFTKREKINLSKKNKMNELLDEIVFVD